MPGLFYLLLILSIGAGFWLVRVLVPKIDRRRNRRRMDREIAEYLALKSASKKITKTRSVQAHNLRKIK
jgi:hypothetical protein